MKNNRFILSIIIVLLISIIACSLTSCRNVSDDLSSNTSDVSSLTSAVEIDYLKIFSDKYISISENEKEDIDSLNNSKVLYEELLISINDYADSVTDAEKEEYENLKELVETEIDSINQKITDLTTIENSSQEVTTSEVTSTASVETSQNTTSSATQTDTVAIPQETLEKVNNPYTVEDFIFPEGSNEEIFYDENNKIYSLPYGTVVIKSPNSNFYSSWHWKGYASRYVWSEKISIVDGVETKEYFWEYKYGGTSMTDEEIDEWSKYATNYFEELPESGNYIGEEIDIGVWVWMP